MASVGLLFVGAVLLINGLLFLGKVDAKTAGVFNLFVGGLQTVAPLYLIVTAKDGDAVLSAAGVLMFGFTYLYVGVNSLAGFEGPGLGWFSLWVAILAVGFAVVNLVRFDDAASALLWFQWAALWGLFFAVIALGLSRLTEVTAWFTIIASFTTCTVPGFVYLLGETVPAWAVVVSIVATVVVLVPVALRTVPGSAVPAPA
ncbi:transporter [Nocardioides mangrovicus]|uniref:Transporter n=1 Tax=Nocardioides mangrovicus TaxID=2478913 RepID=A0A3L8NY06_9ACTN|nr:AmiS/UreI family transporter [Nocardioides mangrovicus]RLV47517.1 transporter [Nocardioides mangrovicus]